MKYQIGQQVWRAGWTQVIENHITCPDCGGTGRIRVTFHDETQVSIDCQRCGPGYNPPRGYLIVHDRKPAAMSTTITGVEIENSNAVIWKTADCYQVEEQNLFDNEADCLNRAKAMAEEADKEEQDRVYNKEKDTRTWAWNAQYHKREIKEAQKKIEYHTAKLNVAAIKAKASKTTGEK